ncbi:MAG TPA: hypothetical protein VK871_12475 [Candidatus Limnocylindrales bacterium]|nr:hypothetical protein [Candidatus Limnocylindrales bacterium]
MAVRLQMKLGVIAEPDRVLDSPDTVVVVEPSVGSVARSKGNLYLIVTSTLASQRAQEATQIAAETIRSEYYYDESAGIRVCLVKAIAAANKRLAHQRDRLGLHGDGENGPIGIGVAVVRGNELYVGTIGPAEAYLIRQARLSTLPDPHRERGLPTADLEPDVWRGEISVGDSLVLISPNVMAKLGPDELKDAMVTLHPQPAMEHLHHRFVASDGSASDAMIAIEATEVASTHKARTLVPVRPAEPLAGAPDRSPIPLADNVTDGVAAVQASAVRARAAAGGAFERLIVRFQEILPRRRTAYRRVTPAAAKRETQRRAAIAVLALVVVSGGLFTVVWAVGGQGGGRDLASLTVGEAALRTARENIGAVFAPGVDLVDGDPPKAMQLLTEAFEALETAAANRVPNGTIAPLRKQAVDGLDRLYGVVPVAPATVISFETSEVPFDITDMVLGPNGVPYILDAATKSVYRIDFRTKAATAIFRDGTKAAGSVEAVPKLMALGASRDLLVVDTANVLWRWRPADDAGAGTTTQVRVEDSASWGDDIRAIGTFLRNASAGLYNFYVVDPSEEQIIYYTAAPDGSGYPADSLDRLAVPRDMSKVDDLYIDGDIFITDDGTIVRFVDGRAEGWTPNPPPDGLLRDAPHYTLLTSATDKRVGRLYAYDAPNARVVAIDKAKGTYIEQYRLAGGVEAWKDLRGMYVVAAPEEDAPATLVWATKNGVYSSILEAVPDEPPASPSPSPSGSGSPAASGAAASGSVAPAP